MLYRVQGSLNNGSSPPSDGEPSVASQFGLGQVSRDLSHPTSWSAELGRRFKFAR
jgi:hypothetical protein